MMKNFEDIQQVSKETMDNAMKSFGALSKTGQAIATQMADYSKKAFEDGTAAAEKLLAAKSIDKALEVQTDYAKTAYENFVAETTKISGLYADFAKEAFKPIEAVIAKAK